MVKNCPNLPTIRITEGIAEFMVKFSLHVVKTTSTVTETRHYTDLRDCLYWTVLTGVGWSSVWPVCLF